MTREENKVYLENASARLKAEVVSLIARGAKDGEVRACQSELARREQALTWLHNRIDTSL